METCFPEDTVVSVDEHHFSQAMRCLISNALKFNPAGGKVTIRVTVDEDIIRVCVTDSGVGMSPVSFASSCIN